MVRRGALLAVRELKLPRDTMPATRTIGRRIMPTAALAALALVAAGTVSASAKDRIYWANRDNNTLAFANLDGSGAAKLNVPAGVTVASPSGVSLDPAAGRIYWTNRGGCATGNAISWMNLEGSGGGQINISGATCDQPVASAIDPKTRRIYWANFATVASGHSKISFAKLDGSGGGDLSTTATVDEPFGVAIDPGAGRIYWTNTFLDMPPAPGTIAFANLDGSGGGNVNVGTAHTNDPSGVAVDPTTRLIYWANFLDNTISFANLNGTGGGQLNTNPIAPLFPEGVAVDIPGGRLYWANLAGSTISFANLNNTGGGNLATNGVSPVSPVFPAILRIPLGTATPSASGGNTVGSTLSCTTGSWAGDILPALLYRAPHGFAFHWTVNGSPVAGATGRTTKANAAGSWRCVVTAANAAGGRSQTSNPVTVFGDSDRDGILDPFDHCPKSKRGRFDKDKDGCPGPYRRLRISAVGTWGVSDAAVQIGTMTMRGLRKGAKVKLSCPDCHVKQTLRAKRSKLALKKLAGKSLRRGEGFTLTATKRGFIGGQLKLTVKQYGHTKADRDRAARNPFTAKHRCLPVGSRKPARRCKARPRTGP